VETSGSEKEETMLKSISSIGKRTRVDILNYFGNFNLKELIDWITDL